VVTAAAVAAALVQVLSVAVAGQVVRAHASAVPPAPEAALKATMGQVTIEGRVSWEMIPRNTSIKIRTSINTGTIMASLRRIKRITAPETAPATMATARRTVPAIARVRTNSFSPCGLKGADGDLGSFNPDITLGFKRNNR
jgi:hypothetical protein